MPMRKSHAKSRNGCNQCKARRVKCDEQLPSCTRCLKRAEKCSFADPPSSATSPHPSTPHHFFGSSDCCTRQHLELELMHHWTTSTSHTVNNQPSGVDILGELLPRTALSHDYLLDGLFSFTALHLASLNPARSEDYISAAVHYRDRGMQRVAPLMQNPSEHDIFAVFWFSVLVGMVTMASTVVAHAPSTPGSRTFTGMLVRLGQLWRGTGVIADMASSLLGEGHELYAGLGQAPLGNTSNVIIEADVAAHLQGLEILISKEESDDAAKGKYRNAIALMRKGWQTWTAVHRMDDMMSFAPELGNDFAAALSAGAPLALLCTLVYGVGLNEIDDRWWASGAGKAIVNECSVALRSARSEWLEVISWARRRVGLGKGIPVAPQDL